MKIIDKKKLRKGPVAEFNIESQIEEEIAEFIKQQNGYTELDKALGRFTLEYNPEKSLKESTTVAQVSIPINNLLNIEISYYDHLILIDSKTISNTVVDHYDPTTNTLQLRKTLSPRQHADFIGYVYPESIQESINILNVYRNHHYSDTEGTKERILADAISDILPKFANLLETINNIQEGVVWKDSNGTKADWCRNQTTRTWKYYC